ncbi:heme exporter protein CcmD [Thalassotalea mangrovi]|uniref:Heme exporter protein D n=1 Tax=Thalassotalea mangrovi TaxID=2572245 RepID=A0A4U1BBI0_9GAMM|nr:heme exporter protein CcmD [Thalassotalea mangrovi]TKB47528.1 heme exporter protein CcmD [Thalassotalea mangrovi]
MAFESFTDFITMGKHGFYIWLSYGSALIILLVMGFNSFRQPKIQLDKIRQRMHREQQLKAYQQKKAEQRSQSHSGEAV